MNQFVQDAIRTESRPTHLQGFTPDQLHALLATLITASKLADTCKRAIFYGKPLDLDKARLETGELITVSEDFALSLADYTSPAPSEVAINLRLLHGAIGVFGEAGELLEALQKQMSGDTLDLVNIAEETGDIDWYQAIIEDETGVSEEATRAKVIAKLRKRYPNKFDSDLAVNRDLVAERAAIEGTSA